MVFMSGSESVKVFLLFIYICIAIRDPIIKRAVGIPLTSLTRVCASPKSGPGFPLAYVILFFFVLNDLR